MRRVVAAITATVALGLGAASASAFSVGTYDGTAGGERVLFTADTHHAHNFDWGSRHLFDDAVIEKLNGVPHFHSHTTRWQVHGHWTDSQHVQGSICPLDSTGQCTREHLRTFAAALKTKQ
jgi:hypothetical protein